MKTIILIVLALLLIACDRELEFRTYEKMDMHCDGSSREEIAAFTLQCIENANPHSDEEPEDWIGKCKQMADATYCPVIMLEITERIGGGHVERWREISRIPKSH